jgi:predicted proteasome-type protease
MIPSTMSDLYHDYLCCDTMNPENVYIDGFELKDMSIVVGLIGNDGIVLATDSQRNKGNFSTISEKLFALTPNIGLMTLGYNAEFRRFVIESWYEADQNTNKSFSDIYYQFALNFKAKIEPYFTKEFRLQLHLANESLDFIVGGYDTHKQARLMAISSSGRAPFIPSECEAYHIDGVRDVGYYWVKKVGIDRLIENNQLNCEFLKRFAVMIILETIKFSGLMLCEPIQLAVVNKNGFHDISKEVDAIKSGLDSRQQWLYSYLDKLLTE